MKNRLLLGIFIVCLVASAILAFGPMEKVCNTNSGCDLVQDSNYSENFGIENSILGFIGFLGLVFLTISNIKSPSKIKKSLIKLGVIGASIIAFYFIYLQLFVIKAICPYCMVVDIFSLIGLIVVFRRKK